MHLVVLPKFCGICPKPNSRTNRVPAGKKRSNGVPGPCMRQGPKNDNGGLIEAQHLQLQCPLCNLYSLLRYRINYFSIIKSTPPNTWYVRSQRVRVRVRGIRKSIGQCLADHKESAVLFERVESSHAVSAQRPCGP